MIFIIWWKKGKLMFKVQRSGTKNTVKITPTNYIGRDFRAGFSRLLSSNTLIGGAR